MTNTGSLKKNNVFKVINVLREHPSLTKPEIVSLTGLTSASVHNFIQELIDKNIVIDDGPGKSNGGRKASLYRLNSKCLYIIGVHISLTEITAAIYDLSFDVTAQTIHEMKLADTAIETGVQTLIQLINELIDQSRLSKSQLAGIGITVPGPVDFENGIINHLVNAPHWSNIPLRNYVEQEIGIHTVVDKNNNGTVIYDKWTRMNKNVKNLVYISITDGVGSAVLIHEKLFRGGHNIAGEIGHMSINPTGSLCNCGNHGCSELYISNRGIVRAAQEEIRSGSHSSLEALTSFGIQDVVTAAKSGDSLALHVLAHAADCFVYTLDNLIKMFDPDEVIIDCFWLSEQPELFASCINSIFDKNKMISRCDIKISLTQVDDILIKGSAALIYDEIFGDYSTSRLMDMSKAKTQYR